MYPLRIYPAAIHIWKWVKKAGGPLVSQLPDVVLAVYSRWNLGYDHVGLEWDRIYLIAVQDHNARRSYEMALN